ncbi:MAG: TAXI family TRAP transporter solute-binding subunit [Microvirga sp.]
MRRSYFVVFTLIAALLGAASEAPAQNAAGVKARGSSRAPAPASPATPMSEAALGERMNANTVAVVSGTPGGTYFRMASDMAFVLDDGDDLRILPILGKGAGQNAYDIRFLKGVDLGFVRTDTLDQLREDKRLTNVDRHITYIARLFNDELHVIAPREVTDIRQLAGKKVSFDVKGSGTDYTGRSMFKGLGLDIEAVNIDQSAAFDLLKRGELAAVVSVAAKPVAVVAGFDPGERFHVLPVPFVDALADKYFPATLTAKDYPKLVPEGATVNTLAVGTVLGAYNWPAKSERYKRIARFIDVFFSKFDEFLKPPRHAKWREVNLAAGLANWKRFPAAQEWLDAHSGGGPATTASNRGDFQRFLNDRKPASDLDRDRLFEEFLKWRGARP